MRYTVRVKPGSKAQKIVRLGETELQVWVRAQPQEGKANMAVIEALAQYLSIPKSRINLLRGAKGKIKIFEISF